MTEDSARTKEARLRDLIVQLNALAGKDSRWVYGLPLSGDAHEQLALALADYSRSELVAGEELDKVWNFLEMDDANYKAKKWNGKTRAEKIIYEIQSLIDQMDGG